jgi:hypothetical protein
MHIQIVEVGADAALSHAGGVMRRSVTSIKSACPSPMNYN